MAHVPQSNPESQKLKYRRIGIFGKLYLEHRLAWLYMTGELPIEVDHKDGNGVNNKFKNLRSATTPQNRANSRKSVKNTSGFKGVSFYVGRGKWVAEIQFNGKRKRLGYFDTPEEAHKAYCVAADKVHGEFANYGKHKTGE
jgi:hypothetical protein